MLRPWLAMAPMRASMAEGNAVATMGCRGCGDGWGKELATVLDP
jgi:hypothetical protein